MMNNQPSSPFSSDLWETALAKYARAANATVELFDADVNLALGPIYPTPIFQLFERKGYDPGLFAECATRCLEQSDQRPTVTTINAHGLAVIGTSLMLQGKIVAAAVVGYVFADFSQVSEIQAIARKAGIGFEELWQITRLQKPVPRTRLVLNGELLQVLGESILRENARARQYEHTALELIEEGKAKDSAHHKLRHTASGLRESEKRFRTLFELGPVAVYSCDAAGVIHEYNDRAAELWGRKPEWGDTDERFCGSFKLYRPDGSFMPHDQWPMADVLSGKVPGVHGAEVHIERPDGSRVVAIVNISPLSNEKGEITGAINCFDDVTERKQAQQVLERSHAELEALVEHRTVALQQLSSNLLRAQDEERRKIARELHDSVGQYLVHAKMTIGSLVRQPETSEEGVRLLSEIASDIDICVSETRTISYLLHPPLLDELGFASAAKSYVEGVSERSGVQVNLKIPRDLKRLPGALELVLMRLLQES